MEIIHQRGFIRYIKKINRTLKKLVKIKKEMKKKTQRNFIAWMHFLKSLFLKYLNRRLIGTRMKEGGVSAMIT